MVFIWNACSWHHVQMHRTARNYFLFVVRWMWRKEKKMRVCTVVATNLNAFVILLYHQQQAAYRYWCHSKPAHHPQPFMVFACLCERRGVFAMYMVVKSKLANGFIYGHGLQAHKQRAPTSCACVPSCDRAVNPVHNQCIRANCVLPIEESHLCPVRRKHIFKQNNMCPMAMVTKPTIQARRQTCIADDSFVECCCGVYNCPLFDMSMNRYSNNNWKLPTYRCGVYVS